MQGAGAVTLAAVEIAALTKTYGRNRALDSVGFRVEPGEVTGLLGLNGAGKTTLFQILSGLFVADAGSVHVFGHDLARNPSSALARMGLVFQQQVIDLDLTVRQNLVFYAGLHGLVGAAARTAIEAALHRFGLTASLASKARALSGGMRRRLELARAMITEPDLLLLDEPSTGLDTGSRADLVRDIFALAKDQRTAVLWATHLVREVEDASHIVVLDRGRVLADGPPRSLLDRTGTVSLEEAFLSIVRRDGQGGGAS